MASTYSTNLALELIGTGDQSGTWGTSTNNNLGTLIEQAISGYVTQAMSAAADVTITIPNGATGVARNMFIECTGTMTQANSLIVPANKKLYFIYNNTTGGFAVTVKVSGQTGVSVPSGAKVILVSNGTDVVVAENYINGTSIPASSTLVTTTATQTLTGKTISGASNTITNVSLTTGVTGTLPVANGGTNATTAQGAINTLAGAVTSAQYLRGNGTNVVMSAIQAADVPTLNQNTTGTAANVTGTVAVANGGTGATTAQGGINALAGAVTSGSYLRGNGTNVVMATIQAGDVPTLNQNTTGTAAGLSATLAIASGGTGATTATAAANNLLPAQATHASQYLQTDGAGTLSWAPVSGASGGTVTNVATAGTVNGITLTGGPITGTGTITLGGTLSGVSLTTQVSGTLPVANGGTGNTTAQAEMNRVAGATTSGSYLRGNGTNVVMSTIQAADVPTLNQNTTGTAAGLSATLAIASGGTGQTTANAALNAFLPSQATFTGRVLGTDGTNTSWVAVGSGTVTNVATSGSVNGITLTGGPITGTGTITLGGTLSGVSLTTQVSGTLPIANGGTGATTAQGGINALAGGVTSGSYLRGNGTNVVLSTIQVADVPTLNQNTTGSAGSVANSVTFNNAGTGAVSGSTFNGNGPLTVSYNTIGAYASSNPSGFTSNTGTVTSVAMTVPAFLSIAGSPVTTSGTLAVTLSGTALPTANGGTGLTTFTSGGAVYASSTSALTTGTLPIASGGTGATTANTALNAFLPAQATNAGKVLSTDGTNTSWITTGSGTVTSVAMTVPAFLSVSGTPITSSGTLAVTLSGTALPVANGGTGVTTSTGTGSVVLSSSPTLVTPVLGTPTSGTLSNCSGLPLSTGVTGTLATGNGGTGLASFTANGAVYASSTSVLTTGTLPVASGGTGTTSSTGSGSLVLATSPTLTTPVLGTPASGNLVSCTADGTNSIGYLNLPQNAQSSNYSLVNADRGKHVYSTNAGAQTITVPTNATAAIDVGAAITIVNNGTTAITFTTTGTTVYKAGTSTAWASGGTLGVRGMCTLIKVATDTWFINGSGLS